MDRSTIIRIKAIETISNGVVIGTTPAFLYNGVKIPLFDEIVNPNTPLPSVGGAQEVYIILQDQQQYPDAVQTVCNPRFDLNLTIRVVTKWGLVGSKRLCEDIGDAILNLLRDARGKSKIDGIQTILLPVSRTITETTKSNLSFSKINILNFIYNG